MKFKDIPIEDFCSTGTGGTPSRSKASVYYGGSIPWVKSGELKEEVIAKTEEYITNLALQESSAKIIPSGAILVAMYGATVGRVAILGVEAATNQAVCFIIPKEDRADRLYLFYALRSKVPELLGKRVGGAQPNISQRIIRETLIPLPSLTEQRRIAAILDKADAIRRNIREGLRLVHKLMESIFFKAISVGFGSAVPWPLMPLESCCTRITDGTHQPPGFVSEGIPFIFVKNIVDNQIVFDTDKFITQEKYEELNRRCPVDLGDILYSTVGTYGQPALVETNTPFAFQRHIAHLKPDRQIVLPEFLAAAMQSSFVKRQADRWVRGVAQPTLNLKELRHMEVPVPKIHDQQEVVDRLRAAKGMFSKKALCAKEADDLFDSLSQRAFSGDL